MAHFVLPVAIVAFTRIIADAAAVVESVDKRGVLQRSTQLGSEAVPFGQSVAELTAQVRVPQGLNQGDMLQTLTPDGQRISIRVPPGAMEGSLLSFTYLPRNIVPTAPPVQLVMPQVQQIMQPMVSTGGQIALPPTSPLSIAPTMQVPMDSMSQKATPAPVLTGHVQLPEGLKEGSAFQAVLPDGQGVILTVPAGAGPGDTIGFTYTKSTPAREQLHNVASETLGVVAPTFPTAPSNQMIPLTVAPINFKSSAGAMDTLGMSELATQTQEDEATDIVEKPQATEEVSKPPVVPAISQMADVHTETGKHAVPGDTQSPAIRGNLLRKASGLQAKLAMGDSSNEAQASTDQEDNVNKEQAQPDETPPVAEDSTEAAAPVETAQLNLRSGETPNRDEVDNFLQDVAKEQEQTAHHKSNDNAPAVQDPLYQVLQIQKRLMNG